MSAKLSSREQIIVSNRSPQRKPLPEQQEPVTSGVDRNEESQDRDDDQQPAADKPQVQSKDIQGLKYFDMLLPLLERLHGEACERDKAKNRELHFDKYCLLVLLYMFNPTVTSLRAIAQASELAKVQEKLGCGRVSLGSLSEASRLFDANLLKEIIQELGEQAAPVGRDARLSQINQTITLIDGSLVSAMPDLIHASVLKQTEGSGLVKWRLHTHFEVDRYVPTRIDVTLDGGGENDERAVAERTIEKDRLYVMDRGYAKFSLFNEVVAKHSSYVCRVRDNSAYEVLEERELIQADRDAGVLSDQIVALGKQTNKSRVQPDHRVRLVCIRCSEHTSRSKYKGTSTGPGSDGILRIATNLVDVPAEIIALIYSQRWIIEIFFRFFKQFLGCSHLISHSQNGIEIQVYCAIIACLLINLWTGRKPTKRTFEMISYYFMGLASESELIAHLEKLRRHDEAKLAKR